MNIISLRVNQEEKRILEDFSKLYNCGVSSMIKKILFEKLEEEYDLKIVKEFEEKEKNNETEFFDYEYVMKELNL